MSVIIQDVHSFQNEAEGFGGGFGGQAFNIFTKDGIKNRRKALMANGALTRDQGRAIDEAVLSVVRRDMVVTQALAEFNLVRPLGGLGVLLDEYLQRSDTTGAEESMDGRTRASRDSVDMKAVNVPIPIISKEVSIPARLLAASQERGTPLDISNIEEATRQVAEKMEATIVNGSSLVYDGNGIQGITNKTGRSTDSLTAAWTATDTRNILKDVRDMLGDLFALGFGNTGPYLLGVPDGYWMELQDDYKAQASQTFLQRILAIPGVAKVVPMSKLAAGQVVLVEMNRRTIDYSKALDITVVPWTSGDGMELKFKVMAAAAPRIKADYNGSVGIAHYSA